jgi:hypothetical protein
LFDQGYTGEGPAAEVAAAKCGFVLLPRRWVVGQSIAWARPLPAPGAGLRAAVCSTASSPPQPNVHNAL